MAETERTTWTNGPTTGTGLPTARVWPDRPDLTALVTTRHGGVSRGPYATLNLALHVGDEPERVRRNRAIVSQAVGIDPGAWTLGEQVHGSEAVAVDESQRGQGAFEAAAAIAGADALVTDRPGICLAVLVADCVPVLLHDPVRRAVGVAHAGWRGTVGRVGRNAVAAMAEAFGSRPADLHAFLGPSIGPDAYEVGPEVVEAIRRAYPDDAGDLLAPGPDGGWHLDLWAANRADLRAAGLDTGRIRVHGASTARLTSRYFSHRAEGPTGRFAALICLRSPT